jgi:hypothetical protein
MAHQFLQQIKIDKELNDNDAKEESDKDTVLLMLDSLVLMDIARPDPKDTPDYEAWGNTMVREGKWRDHKFIDVSIYDYLPQILNRRLTSTNLKSLRNFLMLKHLLHRDRKPDVWQFIPASNQEEGKTIIGEKTVDVSECGSFSVSCTIDVTTAANQTGEKKHSS